MSNLATYHFPPYRLLPARRQLFCGDDEIKLGGRAFDLLLALIERRERVVAKDELIELVWPRLVVEENNLQVQIGTLRKALGHPAVANVPGRGYRFTLPVQVLGESPGPEVVSGAAVPEPLPLGMRERLPVLFGRGDDVRTVQALLDDYAFVTLAGPGGVGKTRLAEAVACGAAAGRADAAWWVELAPLSQPSLLPAAVAAALRLVPPAGDNVEQAVLGELRRREGLLVLDNAEHLVEGVAAFVAEARRHAPRVRVLVTSQVVLRAAGEHVFRTEPLGLPTSDALADVACSPAAALFVARAQAVDRRFALRDNNAASIANLCRGLDGLPLAIELAAARVPLLGVDGLCSMLGERLRLLTISARGILPRHQTLRAALEWSHGLLQPDERAVFRRLAVFVDGFTLDAARHVAADDRIDCWDVIEYLGALVDRSLVLAEGDAAPRYRLLETTRQFALERLAESGEGEAVHDRHQEHFLELADEVRRRFAGRETTAWMQRLRAERDNVLAALAWSQSELSAERGLRLAATMRDFSDALGVLPQGYEATLRVLAREACQLPTAARAAALTGAAYQARLMGRLADGRMHAEEALAIARQVGQARETIEALYQVGLAALEDDDLAVAVARFEEQAAIARDTADRRRLANALHALAIVMARRGELDAAAAYFTENRGLWRDLHHGFNEGVAVMSLADVHLQAGRAAEAREVLADALTIARRIAAPRHMVAWLMQLSGRLAAASDGGGAAAAAAVRVYAALGALRPGAGLSPLELEAVERGALERCRVALGYEATLHEERAGRALGWEHALDTIEYALGSPSAVSVALAERPISPV